MRPLVPLALLLPSLVLAACAIEELPTRMDVTVRCAALDDNRYAGLTLATDVDGIRFVSLEDSPRDLPPLGEPCRTATAPSACRASVAAQTSTQGWQVLSPGGAFEARHVAHDYAAVTRGDRVELITTVEELRRAIAPLDDLTEASHFAPIAGVNMSCDGAPNARVEVEGVVFQRVYESCSGEKSEVLTRLRWDGTTEVVLERKLREADNGCIEGRRPSGLVARTEPWLDSLPAHFSEIAFMEAAAVLAFEELERDLRRVAAPEALLQRIARARRDEIEHAALATTLARRHGREPAHAKASPRSQKASVLQLAIENATEGCVREAFGALVATHQAMHAADPEARAAFVRIAADETEHAELSFDLGAWLLAQLDADARTQVARAQEEAWDALALACDVEPAPEVVRDAGMPTAAVARRLLAALRSSTSPAGGRLAA